MCGATQAPKLSNVVGMRPRLSQVWGAPTYCSHDICQPKDSLRQQYRRSSVDATVMQCTIRAAIARALLREAIPRSEQRLCNFEEQYSHVPDHTHKHHLTVRYNPRIHCRNGCNIHYCRQADWFSCRMFSELLAASRLTINWEHANELSSSPWPH